MMTEFQQEIIDKAQTMAQLCLLAVNNPETYREAALEATDRFYDVVARAEESQESVSARLKKEDESYDK
jgi:2-methylisocitrate lyase-like PEP mutase family enzyme